MSCVRRFGVNNQGPGINIEILAWAATSAYSKNMDKTCILLDKLADWVHCRPAPPLLHAALQRTRSFNTPSPLAGLLFQASGDFGEWRVGDKPWRLPENHLSVGCCHQGTASPEPRQPVELWAVAFDLSGVREFDFLWDSPLRQSTFVNDPVRLTSAFQKVARRFLEANGADPFLLKAALLELFAAARQEFSVSSSGTAPSRPAIDAALEWMAGNFHRPDVGLADVAAAAGMSIHHFGRTFSMTMGKTPMRYLRNLRIRHSCALLRGTSLRINEIADNSGFRDPLHFSRVFHSVTGDCPRDFRRRASRHKISRMRPNFSATASMQ